MGAYIERDLKASTQTNLEAAGLACICTTALLTPILVCAEAFKAHSNFMNVLRGHEFN